MRDLTPFETRVLKKLRLHNGLMARHLASLLWDTQWGTNSRSHGYLTGRATQTLWRLKDQGLVYSHGDGTCDQWSRNIYHVSEEGKALLDQEDP